MVLSHIKWYAWPAYCHWAKFTVVVLSVLYKTGTSGQPSDNEGAKKGTGKSKGRENKLCSPSITSGTSLNPKMVMHVSSTEIFLQVILKSVPKGRTRRNALTSY